MLVTQMTKSKTYSPPLNQESEYKCEFCNKTFMREKSFLLHMCEKKRRWLDRDQKFFKLGYLAYNRFYEISYKSSKKKTTTEFIESKYYNDFIKFGRHLNNISALEPEGFIESLIRKQVKLKDWTNEYQYNEWVRNYIRKESWETALERNMLLILQWSRETGEDPSDFFKVVNTNIVVKWIQTGRLSPWILYTANSASTYLFPRMAEDQLKMIESWIDPKYWKGVFQKNIDDFNLLVAALEAEGF